MPEKKDEMGVSDRLRQIRQAVFGPRGRAAFARAIGISPSTYNYYEKGRQPPADVLARAAEATGADLEWLLTGRGAPFSGSEMGERDTTLSPPLQDILARFGEQAGAPSGHPSRPPKQGEPATQRAGEPAASGTPRGEAAQTALRALLAEIQRVLPAPPGPARPAGGPPGGKRWEPHTFTIKPTYVPIIGRTAAGLLADWEEFFAGREEPRTLERLLRRLEGKAGKERPAGVEPADPGHESQTAFQAATLVQLSEPTAQGCLEFIDLGGPEAAVPGTFGLRVDGDSMAPRILDGDIVISRRDAPPQPGQTAIVKVSGRIGVTVKLWRPEGDRVHLIATNPAYEPTVCLRSDILWSCRVLWVIRL